MDPESGNILHILTHKRILKYVYLHMDQLPSPDFMSKTVTQLGIGSYKDIATVTQDNTIIEALNIFLDQRISALPVVTKDGVLVDIYAKFDVIVSHCLTFKFQP